MEWKWGHAQCEAEVKLDKALVAKIASEPKLEVKVGKHKVACNLGPEDGKESHKLAFAIDPLVTFENGKATKATWAGRTSMARRWTRPPSGRQRPSTTRSTF